jgi:predicted ATPase
VLPRPRFIGRDAERALVADRLDASPLVTIVGPGGVGKTRLAVEAVAGAVVVELADLPVGADVETICGQVGFESPEAAAVALVERTPVLVLDNCEHVVDGVRAFVARFLADARAPRVLATSREPLAIPGEQVVALDALGEDDAVALFLDRAAAAGASWERSPLALAAVGDLCRRLDGLPLAIELAAARSRAFGPATLLQHVDDGLDVLRGVGAAIEMSMRLLDDDERSAFASLGVFVGTFDVGLAQVQLGTDRLRTIDLLARLVDRSLVVVSHHGASTRYRLLELLRDHAARLLVASGGWDAAKERLADGITAEAKQIVVQGVGGWTGDLLLRIDTHLRNLFVTIDWCIEHDDTPARVHTLLLPLFVACHQSRSREVLALGDRVLERWPAWSGDGRAEALAVLATAAVVSGDDERAAALGEAALGTPDATDIARVVAGRAMGFACRGSGRLDAALVHLREGRDAALRLGARSFGRELAGFEGSVLDMQGRGDDAIALLAPEIDGAIADGDAMTEAWLRMVTAAAHARARRWDDARREASLARQAAASASYSWWEGAIRRLEASVAPSWSPELWSAAIDNPVAVGSVGGLALSIRGAAAAAAHHGMDELADALDAAAPWSREVGVLPEVFPAEMAALESRRRTRSAPDPITAVAEARRLLSSGVPVEPVVVAVGQASMQRDGDAWAITWAGSSVHVRDLKGLADIARLLSQPGTEVHCLELAGGSDLGGAGPALDERAKREYQARIRSLQEDIDDARTANDLVRAERAEEELDALVTQLSEAFGLSGRARSTGSAAERARSTVTARIRAAVKRIAEVHPELGRHLDNALRTGTWCSYRPEQAVEWAVTTR